MGKRGNNRARWGLKDGGQSHNLKHDFLDKLSTPFLIPEQRDRPVQCCFFDERSRMPLPNVEVGAIVTVTKAQPSSTRTLKVRSVKPNAPLVAWQHRVRASRALDLTRLPELVRIWHAKWLRSLVSRKSTRVGQSRTQTTKTAARSERSLVTHDARFRPDELDKESADASTRSAQDYRPTT